MMIVNGHMHAAELVELPDLGEQSALPLCRTDSSASDAEDMPTAVVTICGRHSRPIQVQTARAPAGLSPGRQGVARFAVCFHDHA